MENTPEKQKIVVIVGATGSGKTALSLLLAERYNGEVINADSRQVYKGLDIGTEKITTDEMRGIPHHLLSIKDPRDTEVYTAIDFKHDATEAIDHITRKHKLPILAGGTFFYIDSLLLKINAPDISPDPHLRAELETKDAQTLYAELETKDPRRASTIDRHNKRRLMRALEIIASIGHVPEPMTTASPYTVLTLGISVPKDILKERLTSRAKTAVERGLIEETQRLLQEGVMEQRLREIGLEYALVLDHLQGSLSYDELLVRLGEKNWQYAKRQLVWLKRDTSITWVDPSDTDSIITAVDAFLNN